jgi:Zn-dependent protease with chaperone function
VVVVVAAAALFAPRPARTRRGELLDPDDHPELYLLLQNMASAMGAPAPGAVRVDTSYNMSVSEDGWRRTPVLVIGLPLWTVLTRGERLFVLGHELGHLRAMDAWWGQVIGAARSSLVNVVDVLWLSTRSMDGSPVVLFVVWLTSKALRVLAWPFTGLVLLLDALESTSRQRAEYVADRRAARLAGSAAAEAGLAVLLGPPRGEVSASAAMRRDEDPWTALDAVPPRPPREVERLMRLGRATGHHADASHPPSHLRVQLVRAGDRWPGTQGDLTDAQWDAVEEELRPWRARLRRDYEDRLLELR